MSKRNPALSQAMFWSAVREAARLAEHLTDAARRSAYERLSHLILELFVRLNAAGLTTGMSFHLPLTQELIGDALGLTTIHVNRTLQRLRQDNLIAMEARRVTILDFKTLSLRCDFEVSYLGIGAGALHPAPRLILRGADGVFQCSGGDNAVRGRTSVLHLPHGVAWPVLAAGEPGALIIAPPAYSPSCCPRILLHRRVEWLAGFCSTSANPKRVEVFRDQSWLRCGRPDASRSVARMVDRFQGGAVITRCPGHPLNAPAEDMQPMTCPRCSRVNW